MSATWATRRRYRLRHLEQGQLPGRPLRAVLLGPRLELAPGLGDGGRHQHDTLDYDETKAAIPSLGFIDVVGYDGCNMASIEIMELWHGNATAVTGSQEYVGWDGLEYDVFLDQLKANPTMSADQLAINSSASTVSDKTWSALAVDNRMNALVTAVDQWAVALKNGSPPTRRHTPARSAQTRSYWQAPMDKDLYDMATQINAKVTDAKIKAKGTAVMNAFPAVVLHERHVASTRARTASRSTVPQQRTRRSTSLLPDPRLLPAHALERIPERLRPVGRRLPSLGRVSDRNVSPDSGQHWAEEGAWPAAPGVHRIPLPLPTDGLRAVNVYAIETDEGLTLVDGGWAIQAGRAALDKGLAQIGYAASDIRRFLVTHVHRDHYTQAVVVRREFGSRIALGLADKPTLDRVHEGTDDNRIAVLLHDAGAADLADRWVRLVDGPGPDLSHWGYPDEWLEDDVDLAVGARSLRAVATPGHTRGHDAFAEPDAGLLFAGDHVLPTITPSIGFEPVPASLPLGDFLSSLTKVRAMPDALLLPALPPGRAVGERPRRRAPRPSRRAAVTVPERARARRAERVRRRRAVDLDPKREPARRSRHLQPDACGFRDRGPPGAPGRARRRRRRRHGRRPCLRPRQTTTDMTRPAVLCPSS